MSHTIQGITDALAAFGKMLPGVAVVQIEFKLELSDIPDPSIWHASVILRGLGGIDTDGQPKEVERYVWDVQESYDQMLDKLGERVRETLKDDAQAWENRFRAVNFAVDLLDSGLDVAQVVASAHDEEEADAEALAQMDPELRARFESERDQLLQEYETQGE